MADKPKNLSDIDNFWDLNSLLPKKRPVMPGVRQVNTDTTPVEVAFGESPQKSGTPIPARSEAAAEHPSKPLDPYLVYIPENKLITRVEVCRWDSRFNFYENFRTDAKRLWSRVGTECERVSFFSYIPQYSQLKYSQLKWYLWWRENVRRGVYIPTDFCYILLYIYEIINCPELISPEEGLMRLVDVWLAFRSEYRRIDSYMCEWLCDYCLINKLTCPFERLEPVLGEIIASASFKEFYIDTSSGAAAASRLLEFTSDYDWRAGRYVTPDTLPVFSTHIKAAFDKACREILLCDGGSFAKEIRIQRTAYEGALCAYDIKRTVAVEYISHTRSPKFRFAATDIIKYSENRVRMALGIKSRLKADSLTEQLKACIDEYFDEHLPAPKKTRRTASNSEVHTHDYDKLYEPATTTLSLENALKIEERSWKTTEALTSAFEEEEPIKDADTSKSDVDKTYTDSPRIAVHASDDEDEFAEFISMLGDSDGEAFRLVALGSADGIKRVADATGILPEAIADRINEAAFDIIGDSIIEPSPEGYKLIPDYKEDILKWLK